MQETSHADFFVSDRLYSIFIALLEGRPSIDLVFSVTINAKTSPLSFFVVFCFICVEAKQSFEATKVLIDYVIYIRSFNLDFIVFLLQSRPVSLH